MTGIIGPADTDPAGIMGPAEVEGPGGITETSSAKAALGMPGGSAASVTVEEAPASLALADRVGQLSRKAPSALAPRDLTDAL
jgi:hypothetical protein